MMLPIQIRNVKSELTNFLILFVTELHISIHVIESCPAIKLHWVLQPPRLLKSYAAQKTNYS